jgi:hypothetical protein
MIIIDFRITYDLLKYASKTPGMSSEMLASLDHWIIGLINHGIFSLSILIKIEKSIIL